MANIRIILIVLHVLITCFLIYDLHPHLTKLAKPSDHEQQISSIIGYINNLFRIALYHSSCIIAIWYSRRYAAGLIGATGVLLIGELLETITIAVRHTVERHDMHAFELVLAVIYVWICISAIIITFRLAKQISNHQKDLMQVELLTTTTDEEVMNGGGHLSLV